MRPVPVVCCVEVGKTFEVDGEVSTALTRVTFTVRAGQFVFLTGPSGAGKTTLAKLLYGEYRADEGEIKVCGEDLAHPHHNDLAQLRRRLGVIPQELHLVERRSLLDNVLLPLLFTGVKRREAIARAEAELDRVGLVAKRKHSIRELSGGEKQFVSLARALVARPTLIVADEPTANLDRELADEFFRLLGEAHAAGAAVVVATHDRRRVETSGHATLSLADGRIAAVRGEIEATVR